MDKILETKKSIKKIVKRRDLTRMQRHNLVLEELKTLASKEQRILKNEYSQDIKVCERAMSIKDYFCHGTNLFALMISISALYYNSSNVTLSSEDFSELLLCVMIGCLTLLFIVMFSEKNSSNSSHIAEYALDIFAELEEDKK